MNDAVESTSQPQNSVAFFDRQFLLQIEQQDFHLNPFETQALLHLTGKMLDFGCGLGNLAIAAAERGCQVLALDASPVAIAALRRRAATASLPVEAIETDLRTFGIEGKFDSVVSIGLLSFLDCATAMRVLDMLLKSVAPGGVAVINTLIVGTTWIGMFDAADCCLLPRDELHRRFAEWEILRSEFRDFPAPGGTIKSFATVAARKPATNA